MSIDAEVLAEAYSILKQYIPTKDRQEAADNLLSVLVDMLDDQELRDFGSTDSQLKKALTEYVSDDDADTYDDYE